MPDFSITISNNSNDGIVFYAYDSKNASDTSLMENLPWFKPENSLVQAGTSTEDFLTANVVKSVLDIGFIHYYIFIYDSIKTIPWERIRDEYIVAKRVDFDRWEDLEACNFTIIYP